jgi:predicted Zn-dependent protease with MMP-like domain
MSARIHWIRALVHFRRHGATLGSTRRNLEVDTAQPRHGYRGGVPIEMSPERFDALVDEALDGIPAELAALVHNVVVLVEAHAPAEDPDILGLYDGIALTDRSVQDSFELPDRIFIFRDNLLAMCESEAEVADEVRITVVHEIAHHFGIDDDRLHALGWG